MKKIFITIFVLFFLSIKAYGVGLPNDLKSFLKEKFPGIVFKIDNSFVINNEIFLPLIPRKIKEVKKIELVYIVQDKQNKTTPKLFWFSNDFIFVKLLKQKDGLQTIVNLSEIDTKYKERFLNSTFPSDLVVPKNFILKEEIASLGNGLPIKIAKASETPQRQQSSITSGILYLTSPDTGRIVYIDLMDFSMINYVQTEGAPWEFDFNKEAQVIYATDFAKDRFYKLNLLENNILKTFELSSMSSPRDIKVSSDGTVVYVLENLTNDFVVYLVNEQKALVKTKLPLNPTSFSILKELNLIAITCPSRNSIVLLNLTNFARIGQIMVGNGPEKIISDPKRNLFYVANRNEGTVSIVDPILRKVKTTISVEETPTAILLDPNGKFLYIGNGKSNTISIVDLELEAVIYIIKLPVETQFPGDLEITNDGKWLITTSETTNTISIIDLNSRAIHVKLDVGATTHAALLVESKK